MAGDHEAITLLMAIARKDQPAARRQALAALGQIGDPTTVPALLDASANPDDRFVEHPPFTRSSLCISLPQLRRRSTIRARKSVRPRSLPWIRWTDLLSIARQ